MAFKALPIRIFTILLCCLSHTKSYAQNSPELPIEVREVESEEIRITEEGKKPYFCDAMDFVADDKNFHLLFTDERKLYYSFSINKGRSWETELVAYIDNEEDKDPQIKIKVGDRGTVHLFFPELKSEETVIWHYSRPLYSLGWSKEIIYSGSHAADSKFDMDVDVDCNNSLFVVYNAGDGFIRYSSSKWQKWEHQKLPYGNETSGCAIVSGFDQNVFIAIANEQGDLKLLSKKVSGGDWKTEQVTGPVYGECDITLMSNGGLLVVSSEVRAGPDKPYQLSIRKPDGSWSNHSLSISGDFNLGRGALKNVTALTDPSGKIHLTHYFTDYSAPNNKSLAHLFSYDRGNTWQAEVISANINGYVGRDAPSLSWTDNKIFIAVKDSNQVPVVKVLWSDRNLKEFPRCLYRRNPMHDTVHYERDTTSRIVDVPVASPEPEPKHTPTTSSNPNTRKTSRQGTFVTSDSSIKVIVRDYQDIDGDRISIFFNGQCILCNYSMIAFDKVVEIEIDPEKEQLLRFYAESEGSKPPCTVSLSLRDSRRTQKYVIKSNLKENGTVVLNPAR